MSFQALEWARKLPIPPTPKFLMMVIASYTDTDDACFPALTTLAGDTRQSIDSVRRQVVKLQCAGLLLRYPRWSTGKNIYEVGPTGAKCPHGCRRTSDKIQLLLDADLDAAAKLFDPDGSPNSDPPPVADCEGPPVADCEGGDSNLGATTPVATMVLPQEDSLEPKSERERARARGLLDFKKKWPTTAYDDPTKVDAEWSGLPDEDWPKALQFIEPYLGGLKRIKRTHIPAGQRYLHDRPWIHMPAEVAHPTSVFFDAWSKDWWAVLFAKADRRESLSFHVDWAIQGKKFAVKYDTMPVPETIAALKPFRANGPEIVAWHPWVRERGGKLPEWTQDFWVFLPSPEPPVAGTPALRITGPPVAA